MAIDRVLEGHIDSLNKLVERSINLAVKREFQRQRQRNDEKEEPIKGRIPSIFDATFPPVPPSNFTDDDF